MSPDDMEKLAPPKAGGCFSKGSQSYNQILDLLKTCHGLLREADRLQDHDRSTLYEPLRQLKNACNHYLEKNQADEGRKGAVERLRSQIEELKAMGNPYFTARDNGQVDYSNLNGKARFAKTKGLIACRHLAFQELVDRKKEDDDPAGKGPAHRVDRRAEQRGTAQDMAERMDPRIEARFTRLERGTYQRDEVDHSKWGEYFSQMFDQMQNDSIQHRYIFLRSDKHTMSIRLRIKKDSQGQPRFVINFNNPNHTFADKRFFTNNLEQVKSLQIGDFLDAGRIARHYNRPGDENYQQYSTFEVLPNRFYSESIEEFGDVF
jgi:hypothetical protein